LTFRALQSCGCWPCVQLTGYTSNAKGRGRGGGCSPPCVLRFVAEDVGRKQNTLPHRMHNVFVICDVFVRSRTWRAQTTGVRARRRNTTLTLHLPWRRRCMCCTCMFQSKALCSPRLAASECCRSCLLGGRSQGGEGEITDGLSHCYSSTFGSRDRVYMDTSELMGSGLVPIRAGNSLVSVWRDGSRRRSSGCL
jgi:hypothetical protein